MRVPLAKAREILAVKGIHQWMGMTQWVRKGKK